jgi:hypothetical protein
MDHIDILKLVWPIIVLQIGLQIYAIVDVLKKKKTKNLSPAIWIVIIIIGEIIGPVAYLLAGRSED